MIFGLFATRRDVRKLQLEIAHQQRLNRELADYAAALEVALKRVMKHSSVAAVRVTKETIDRKS